MLNSTSANDSTLVNQTVDNEIVKEETNNIESLKNVNLVDSNVNIKILLFIK